MFSVDKIWITGVNQGDNLTLIFAENWTIYPAGVYPLNMLTKMLFMRKFCHLRTGSCRKNNIWHSQWWKFLQNGDISISVLVDIHSVVINPDNLPIYDSV